MDELGAILGAWRRMRDNPGSAVLATVVHVEGSAYRRPGARMLICEDGNCVGSISGGCLEGDVTRKAAWWTADGKPVLRVYDTSSEEAAWEFGLGCKGVITLMLERLSSASADEALRFVDERRRRGRSCVVATVIRATDRADVCAGDRLLWSAEGLAGGSLATSALRGEISGAAAAACEERHSRLIHLGEADVFVEFVPARQQLVLFGAGHDAMPLVVMSAQLGWSITVADGRPAYAKAARFPAADAVVVLPATADISAIEFDSNAAVVMMTHNYPQDLRLLPQILARRPKFLGMLGPRSRAESVFEEIGQRIGEWDVHAPAGLDTGGEAPAAIALSIVAEIQSVLERRSAVPLKFRKGPIHASPREIGARGRRSAKELAELTGCAVNA